MITLEDTIRRLDNLTQELVELRRDLRAGWRLSAATFEKTPNRMAGVQPREDPADARPPAILDTATQAFLAKCGGWDDHRKPEQIIADIYSARSSVRADIPAFQ